MKAIHFLEGDKLSYPINLDIGGKICVVLGGGHVALRKIIGLLNAGGKVIVISSDFCEEIKHLAESEEIKLITKNYSSGCIPKGFIFIAASSDSAVNESAALEAAAKHMLVNVVNKNNLDINQFNVPSVIRRGNLTIAISTEGLSPALSKCIRQHLEEQFNDNIVKWLKQLSKIREEIKYIIKDSSTREEFWRNVMSNENFSLAQSGELDKAEVNVRNVLESYRCKSQDCAD